MPSSHQSHVRTCFGRWVGGHPASQRAHEFDSVDLPSSRGHAGPVGVEKEKEFFAGWERGWARGLDFLVSACWRGSCVGCEPREDARESKKEGGGRGRSWKKACRR